MIKKSKFFSLLLILPLLILILNGCGKSVSRVVGEKATENIIENQLGGSANVDINNGSVKIDSQESKFELGSNVKLPADFPGDVYVIEGNIITAMSNQVDKGFTISIETAKSLAEASSIYQEKLKQQGWGITGTMNSGDSISLVAQKDSRTVTVFINRNGDKTNVILSVGVMVK